MSYELRVAVYSWPERCTYRFRKSGHGLKQDFLATKTVLLSQLSYRYLSFLKV